jgi:hypothetical protein
MSRWLSIPTACLLLVASGLSVGSSRQTGVKNDKKVTVTLVRWPYT